MRFAILDIETTGGNPKTTRITELAIYVYEHGEIVDEFCSLINPNEPIPEFVINLTGITDEMVKKAPSFSEKAVEIYNLLEGAIFVAHNANSDYKIMRHEFLRLNIDYKSEQLCTIDSARKILPNYESYSLGKLSRALGIQLANRHRASGDALATVKLFELMIKKDSSTLLKQIIPLKTKKEIDHAVISSDQIKSYPETTGVFYFYDDHHELIYIGYGENIRESIIHLFKKNKSKKVKRIKTAIDSLGFEETGNLLIAEIKATNDQLKYQPRFSKISTESAFPFSIYQTFNSDGYSLLKIAPTTTSSDRQTISFIKEGEAYSFLQRLTIKQKLCLKLNGLESSSKACRLVEINKCNGSCTGEESTEIYNNRVEKSIGIKRFNPSNIILLLTGRTENERAFIVVKDGKYMGYGYIPTKMQSIDDFSELIISSEAHVDILTFIRSYVRRKKSGILEIIPLKTKSIVS